MGVEEGSRIDFGSILGGPNLNSVWQAQYLQRFRQKTIFSFPASILSRFWSLRGSVWRSRALLGPPRGTLEGALGAPGALPGAPWACFWRSLDASKIALWCCGGARGCPELF